MQRRTIQKGSPILGQLKCYKKNEFYSEKVLNVNSITKAPLVINGILALILSVLFLGD